MTQITGKRLGEIKEANKLLAAEGYDVSVREDLLTLVDELVGLLEQARGRHRIGTTLFFNIEDVLKRLKGD